MTLEIASLIERLNAMEEPDQIVDAEIAETLGHRTVWEQSVGTMETQLFVQWQPPHPLAGTRQLCPAYTASIDAAMTLVPKKCDSVRYIDDPSGTGWELGQFDNTLTYHERGVGMTGGLPAIALCIAALKARFE